MFSKSLLRSSKVYNLERLNILEDLFTEFSKITKEL